MIPEEEVKHIAKLARLGLWPKEIKKMGKELSSILGYMEKLKEVNISKVDPTSHPILVENTIREDRALSQPIERINKLIELVPEEEKGYVKVKAVLQHEVI